MGNSKHSNKQGKSARRLLELIGVDNPGDVLKDDKNFESFCGSLKKCLGTGKRAVDKLSTMQSRDVQQEIIDMGVDPKSIGMKHETLAEFQAENPAFVIAKSIADQSFRMFDGSSIDVKDGDEVCLTTSMYQRHVMQRPTIVPASYKFSDIYKPYRGQDLSGKTLFVWRSGGIGDLLFIRPILMAFKEQYSCQIILATREKYHSMVEQWDDCIDVLSNVPFLVKETLADADYHITYEGLIERCHAAEEIDVHDLFARHSFINVRDWNRPMDCVCKNKVFSLLPNDYAVMQLGSSSITRTPFFGKLLPVADHITKSRTLVISGSRREAREIDDFISCCRRPDRIINFAHYTGSIVDAVKLVTDARIVVGPDSSHVHMAAAQGVPVVGIYGPFRASCRTTHYEACITVEPRASKVCEFGGRGCFRHAHQMCEYQTKCWNNLDPQDVIDAVEELLS